MSEINAGKLVDTIANRQTQYYTLWGFYTVVQFSVACFGSTEQLTLGTAVAGLIGAWAFNIGHLGFVLTCVAQLNRLTDALDAVLKEDKESGKLLKNAFTYTAFSTWFWKKGDVGKGYLWNFVVHLLIDVCASLALLARVSVWRIFH
jgi:hypothetical protein